MGYSFKTKIIIITACALAWFVFGTLMIIRGSKNESDLKLVSGRLVDFRITEVIRYSRFYNNVKIPILQFVIENSDEKLGLHLSSLQDYEPILEKIKNKDRLISILYLDSWPETKEGINLHIYNIKYGEENLISIGKIASTDKKVGLILYLIGLIFCSLIIFVTRQERKKLQLTNAIANAGLRVR